MRTTTNVSTVAPVFPDDGPRGARIARRLRAIPLEILAFLIVTPLLPVLLIVAALSDLVLWLRRRKPWAGVRLTLFLWWFLFGEMQALVALLWIWLRGGGPFGGDTLKRRRRHLQPRVPTGCATTCAGSAPSSGCGSRSRASIRRVPGRSS